MASRENQTLDGGPFDFAKCRLPFGIRETLTFRCSAKGKSFHGFYKRIDGRLQWVSVRGDV